MPEILTKATARGRRAARTGRRNGYILDGAAQMDPLGTFYSLPSETSKYTHGFLARPVISTGTPALDTEIEKYFDMSVLTMPLDEAYTAISGTIRGMETAGALMMARNLTTQGQA